MKLQEVRIEGFRCLRDVTLTFDELTILLGENSTGKSSLLRALKFFFEDDSLDREDSFDGCGRIAVQATFGGLTEADRTTFAKYGQGTQMVLRRTWDEGQTTFSGLGLVKPQFDEVRHADGAAAKRTAYRSVRETHTELPDVRLLDDIEQAMLTWEMNHPDQCVEREDDATSFFGFTSVGQSRLARRFKFVFVPGLRDAAAEAVERKGSLLEQLLTAIAEQRAQADAALASLETETLERYREVVEGAHGPTLAGLAESLSEQMRRYVPKAKIRLQPEAPTLKIRAPAVVVSGGEERHQTDLGRQGHGFQRTFIIATLEYLASRPSSGPDESGARPTLFLAIEEPELYQHPPRARHFSETLSRLTSDEAVQVCYATHSPYFVSAPGFSKLRLFRRRNAEGVSGPPETTVSHASHEVVASRVPGMSKKKLSRSVSRTMDGTFREAFFARVAVLVEGETDVAVFVEASRLAGLNLLASGVIFVSTTKTGLATGRAILEAFEIPTYVVFDADADKQDHSECRECGRGGAMDRTSAEKANDRLLAALDVEASAFPPTGAHGRWACFNENLECELEKIAGFNETAAEVANELGWKRKSPEVYGETLQRLGGDAVPSVIREVVERVVALAD